MAKVLVALVTTLVLLYQTSSTQARIIPADTTPPPTAAAPPISAAVQDFLDAHNKARAEVGVSPLKWSEKLANSTSLLVRYQRDKKSCNFADLAAGKYGGNQMWASGSTAATPRAVVEAWVAEKEYYNYTNNTCVGDHRCGVYTQVVWRKSVELGCGQATCAKERASLTVCFYDPPGNVIGEKPY